jgi:A/G-specific adenine glycosylase
MDYDFFRRHLLEWAEQVDRPLPWKGKKDPYLIWLSEILLQQTRAAQGTPYYRRFTARFPDVQSLAQADPDEVMKLWEGLGYYARARNLMKTAKIVAHELGGRFPENYEGLRALPGIGTYTAAAIASFAYQAPHAVLDGNVYRVLSRFFGISEPTDTSAGRRQFEAIAQNALDTVRPAAYNQAIMDFGALCCTPKNPDCNHCPLQEGCSAFRTGMASKLPVKLRAMQKRARFFHYLVVKQAGKVAIQRREQKDIWQHLYEFPMLELPGLETDIEVLTQHPQWPLPPKADFWTVHRISRTFKQELTHQKIYGIFIEIEMLSKFTPNSPIVIMVEHEKINNFAFPKIIDTFWKDQTLFLNLI